MDKLHFTLALRFPPAAHGIPTRRLAPPEPWSCLAPVPPLSQEFEDIREKVAGVLAGKYEGDEYAQVALQQVPAWVKRSIMGKHTPDENRFKVNAVLQDVYKVRYPRHAHA